MKKEILAFIILSFICSIVQANIIRVEFGTTYPSITSALAIAMDGDTLDVYGTITKDGSPKSGITIDKNVTIQGQGIGLTIIEAGDNSNSDRRVFTILQAAIVLIKNLEIRNGHVDVAGGAIENLGTLSVNNCKIYACTGNYGGGIRNGIGGNLSLYNTIISSNTATLRGGGINHIGENLQINRCSIEHNSAFEEGGGIQIENANSLISNTLIKTNLLYSTTLNSNGAGIFIGNSSGDHLNTFVNVTISQNKGILSGAFSSCGGGIGLISIAGKSDMILMNCTVANNEVDCGQGIQSYTYNTDTKNAFYVTNCIISNGLSDNYFEYSDGGNTMIYRNYTMLSDNSIDIFGDSNMNNTDPHIEELADNGGPTETHALINTSPAINAGTDINAPEKDQRGASRVGKTDIGAYEYTGVLNFDKQTNEELFQIYPNPSNGIYNIIFQNATEVYIEVYDQSGRNIISSAQKEQNFRIDISKFPNGMYILKAICNNEVATTKLIKQ